jgi:hypothetical protein
MYPSLTVGVKRSIHPIGLYSLAKPQAVGFAPDRYDVPSASLSETYSLKVCFRYVTVFVRRLNKLGRLKYGRLTLFSCPR